MDADGNEIFDKDGSPWGCSWYANNVGSCGAYDSDFFKAALMCCECGGGCTDGMRNVESQTTEEACPAACFFSAEGCPDDGPDPPTPQPEQWEQDFTTCDVSQDQILSTTEIEDCFTSLCNTYICAPTTDSDVTYVSEGGEPITLVF